MGKSSGNKKLHCSCGFLGLSSTREICPKCNKRGRVASISHNNPANEDSILGGRMDSKHFSSRSTTDNLPSSLSTPGERAGLTSASPAAVDTTSVATSSTSPNTMSPHLPSTCGTSGPADITSSHSTVNPVNTEAEVDTSRLPPPPDTNDSESSHSTTSDKSYDPNCDSVCSSNSCSSLASSLSAVISSSSKGLNDELFVSDFQGNGLSSMDGPSHSQSAKNSITSSSTTSNNGQNGGIDTIAKISNTVASSNSNKDNLSSSERPDDQNKEGLSSSTLNAKSHPAASPLTASSLALKDPKPSAEDQSPQLPLSRGVKRTHEEIEEPCESSPSLKPSPQKNKKRCFICSCKLELAQRTIGKCRCEHVFCPIHRLPELHDCEFNHKEDGRREAREKMVKPTRHMGTSFRRDDQT